MRSSANLPDEGIASLFGLNVRQIGPLARFAPYPALCGVDTVPAKTVILRPAQEAPAAILRQSCWWVLRPLS